MTRGLREIATVALAATLLLACGPSTPPGGAALLAEPLVWRLGKPGALGGCAVEVLGEPRTVEEGGRPAVAFDGIDDALLVDCNPLRGVDAFTVEVVFRPAKGGPGEQRFVHVQESGTSRRLLFETRIRDDGLWFLDTFVRSGDSEATLFARHRPHPPDRWTHAAIVVDDGRVRHFVNGREELSRPLPFEPFGDGVVSIGARANRVSWFRGSIREIRFTPWALSPQRFSMR